MTDNRSKPQAGGNGLLVANRESIPNLVYWPRLADACAVCSSVRLTAGGTRQRISVIAPQARIGTTVGQTAQRLSVASGLPEGPEQQLSRIVRIGAIGEIGSKSQELGADPEQFRLVGNMTSCLTNLLPSLTSDLTESERGTLPSLAEATRPDCSGRQD